MNGDSRPYPVGLTVDFPDRTLNRLTSFFRLFMLVPIAIVLALISGAAPSHHDAAWRVVYGAGGIIFLPTLLMILFRWKYPRWWFDWNAGLWGFTMRVAAYGALLCDRYPSTDEEQEVHVTLPYPDVRTELLPGLPLVKWFLAIPHYVVLLALFVASIACIIIAWFAILFTGRYPRSLFGFVVGVLRWETRVVAYAFLLVTDRYPPFRLSE